MKKIAPTFDSSALADTESGCCNATLKFCCESVKDDTEQWILLRDQQTE
jgi:hypothetical protein